MGRFLRFFLIVGIFSSGFLAAPRAVEARRAKPGDVISTAPMALGPQFAPGVKGYAVKYYSSDSSGRPIVVSGAVLVPAGTKKSDNRAVVSWAHGTAGSADRCAPSRSPILYPESYYTVYAEEVSHFLNAGFVVAASDFPGLGTPGPAQYLIGNSEGRSIIDIVRAANVMKVGASKDWFSVGHSQGGQGALFAGELADTYGKGLKLKGVVGIAPVSSIDVIAQAIVGTPFQGYLALALGGLQAAYPQYSASQDLAAPAEARFGVIETGCFDDVAIAFGDLSAEEMVEDGQLSSQALELLAAQNPVNKTIHAPLLLQQGTLDDTVPVDLTRFLASQRCGLGDAVQLVEYDGEGHDSVVGVSTADTIAFMKDRLAHKPFISIC